MDDPTDFSCNQCGNIYEEEVFLFLHQYKNHDKTPFKCKECGESGVGQQKLYYHMKSHREARLKIYRCHLCPFEEPKLDIFQKHAQLHAFETERSQQEKDSTICDIRGEDFLSQNNHGDQKQSHKQELFQYLPCAKCDMKFSQNDHLMDHENAVHAEDFKVVVGSNSKTLNMSNTDIVVRNEEKPFFKANFVNATQQRKNALEDFFESPNTLTLKSELAQCEVCNNSMSKYSLSRHMKTVHGARGRKWECSDCGKCLQSKSRLNHHMLRHTVSGGQVEGSFSCAVCKYTTTNKDYLTDHFNMNHKEEEGLWVCHLGKCSENPKSFINPRLLSRHQGTHENVSCLECEKVFGAKRNMIRHMRVVHKQGLGQTISDSK